MPVELPSFNGTDLTSFSFCLWFSKENVRLKSLIDDDVCDIIDCKYGGDSDSCFAQLNTVRFSDGDFHCHVNLGIAGNFSRPPEDLVTLDAFLERLSLFIGEKGDGWSRVRFRFPLTKLPKVGIIQSFSGIRAEIFNSSLTLRGASFGFENKEFEELSWTLADEAARGSLRTELDSHEFRDSSFQETFDRLMAGIDRFVLERE